MKTKRFSATMCGLLFFLAPIHTARADFFGGDLPLLAAILANAVQQLSSLGSIIKSGGDTLGLMRAVNQGINDALSMAQTLGIRVDPGIYGQVSGVSQTATMITQLYGPVPNSPLAPSQQATDQTAAEAISFHNDLFAYADRVDGVGENIKAYSRSSSPGRASKLTAESIGVLIHVMNQQLRATGKGLKLQAQALAIQNKHEKDQTEEYLKESQILKAQMMATQANFDLPRF